MKTKRNRLYSQKRIGLASLFALVTLILNACTPGVIPNTGLTPTASVQVIITTAPPSPTTAAILSTTPRPLRTETLERVSSPTPVFSATPFPTDDQDSAEGVGIQVARHTELGEIVVDNKGMTLYIFTLDEPGKSNCTGSCMLSWPPLLSSGNPQVGPGVNASLIGTASLEDGAIIVTYDNKPLYFWVGDQKPGDAAGHGVSGVWYVIRPDGTPVFPDIDYSYEMEPDY